MCSFLKFIELHNNSQFNDLGKVKSTMYSAYAFSQFHSL